MTLLVFLFVSILLFVQIKYNTGIEKVTSNSRNRAIKVHNNLKELICNLLSFIQNSLVDFPKNKSNTSENDFKNAKVRTVFKTTAYRSIISLIIGLLTVLIKYI